MSRSVTKFKDHMGLNGSFENRRIVEANQKIFQLSGALDINANPTPSLRLVG